MTLRARLVVAAAWAACRLPEPPLLALADLAGRVWYRLAPERRRRARRNLARVARWLAERNMGTPEVRAAAHDRRALNRLVREAFKHAARYYVQLARAPMVDHAYLDRWLVIETPEFIDTTLMAPGGKLFAGCTAGRAAHRRGTLCATWSVRDDQRSRASHITSLKRSASSGSRALPAGTDFCDWVGPLNVRHRRRRHRRSSSVRPRSPRVGAAGVETGVTPNVFGVWRDASGVYHAIEAVLPAEGTRRERVTTYLNAEARPSSATSPSRPSSGWRSPPGLADLEQARPPDDAAAGARTCTSTRSPRTGRRTEILDHVERNTELDVIAITDHERIDAALAGRAMARDRGLSFEVVVGEEVTTLGGHLLALWIETTIKPFRSLRSTIAAIHDQGGIAIPAHPLVPYPLCAQGFVLRRLLADEPRYRPDAIEAFNPTTLGRPWQTAWSLRRRARPRPRRQLRRPRARRHRVRYTTFQGHDGARCARDRGRDHAPPRDVPRDRCAAGDVRRAAAKYATRGRPGRPLAATPGATRLSARRRRATGTVRRSRRAPGERVGADRPPGRHA
jgi:hypothetical protein